MALTLDFELRQIFDDKYFPLLMGRFVKFSFDKMETIAVHIQRPFSQKISSPVYAAKHVLLCMGNGTLSAVQGGCFARERDPRV